MEKVDIGVEVKDINKKKGGKLIPYPEDWNNIYNNWQSGRLTAPEACKSLDFCSRTFYNMVKRYEQENGIIRKSDNSSKKGKYEGLNRITSINGKYALLSQTYNDYIQRNVLPRIDYQKLNNSYQTKNMEYAKGIFNLFHSIMIEVYGSDTISAENKSELILIPGVVTGGGEICLSLLVVDLTGAIKEVNFLTDLGCFAGKENLSGELKKKLNETVQRFTPYVCGYAADLPGDNFSVNALPPKAQELLLNFREYKVRLLCDWNNE